MSASRLAIAAAVFAAFSAHAAPLPKVDVYSAEEADVNAFVLSDAKGVALIDATRNSREAHKVGELALSKGHAPATLLITHGHPDHYLGMGELKRMFPKLKIVVASQAVKDDIIQFTQWMDGQGWLEKEPSMKPRSAQHPDGFDYSQIQVLQEPVYRLPGGATLQVKSDYAATEAEHETTLYSPELNALFAGDLVYNKVHLWLGVGVSRPAVAQWQQTLGALEAQYGARGVRVYPGHGAPADASLFEVNRQYMATLLKIVDGAADEADAQAKMVARYPDYRNAGFLLAQSVKFQLTQK